MTEKSGKGVFACDFPGCDKVYPKQWRLKEHQCSVHTGEVKDLMSAFSSPSKHVSCFRDRLSVNMKDVQGHISGVLILNDTYK